MWFSVTCEQGLYRVLNPWNKKVLQFALQFSRPGNSLENVDEVLSSFFSKLQQVLLKWNLVHTFAEYEKGFVPAYFKVSINHLFDNLESGKRDYCLEKSMEKVLNFGALLQGKLDEWQQY